MVSAGDAPAGDAAPGSHGHAAATATATFSIRTPRVPVIHAGPLHTKGSSEWEEKAPSLFQGVTAGLRGSNFQVFKATGMIKTLPWSVRIESVSRSITGLDFGGRR